MVYEYPLDAWRDVAGSTVKGGDFVKAIGELVRIWWTFLRPAARGLAPEIVPLGDMPGRDPRRDQQRSGVALAA